MYRGDVPAALSSGLDPILEENISIAFSGPNQSFILNESLSGPGQVFSPNQSFAEFANEIGRRPNQGETTSWRGDEMRITELEKTCNKAERIYRYRSKPLYALPDITRAFDRYNEMVGMPNQKVEDSIKGDLLDSNYLAEERTKIKNSLIINANSKLKYIDLPVWDTNKHTEMYYIFKMGNDFKDSEFEFSEKVLKEEKLTSKRIRDYGDPSIFHEETMAEGIIFSERNLTPISAALSCLIHFDSRLRTRLVKNLIYPQDVR